MQVEIYPNKEIRISISRGRRPRREKKVKADLFNFCQPEQRGSRGTLLDIPPELSQMSEKAERRRFPMSRKAQIKILRLAGVMSDEDRSRQVFATGTLPGSTKEAIAAFSRLSGYAVKLVQTYLCRFLKVGSQDLSWCYVWEQQKRGALHMHLVCECPSEGVANSLLTAWREIWERVLVNCGEKAGCDLFERAVGGSWQGCPEQWQIDAQIVTDGVSRYLSKYLSKGSEGDPDLFPARWYGASRLLRKRLDDFVANNSFYLPFHVAYWCDLEDVKRGILEAFAEFSPKGGKDVSQWFQDWSATVFGFIGEGRDLNSCVDLVLKRINRYVALDGGKKTVDKSQEDRAAIADAVHCIFDKIPQWTRLQLGCDFSSALGIRLTPENVATREGFTQFGAVFRAMCELNDSPSVTEWQWPKSAWFVWVHLEQSLNGRQFLLPWYDDVTIGEKK